MASCRIKCSDNVDIHKHHVPLTCGYPTIFRNAGNTFIRTLLQLLIPFVSPKKGSIKPPPAPELPNNLSFNLYPTP
jgi:hypothetical protein